jgi:transcriptional regulator with XRE-family HTH domain
VSSHKLDVRALYAALDVVRAHEDLSWRGLAEQVGVSPSTFSRMALGSRPDADALCTLVTWLRVPLDRFVIREDAIDASGECDCGHDGLDEMFHLMPCPIAERRFARRQRPIVTRLPDVGGYDGEGA